MVDIVREQNLIQEMELELQLALDLELGELDELVVLPNPWFLSNVASKTAMEHDKVIRCMVSFVVAPNGFVLRYLIGMDFDGVEQHLLTQSQAKELQMNSKKCFPFWRFLNFKRFQMLQEKSDYWYKKKWSIPLNSIDLLFSSALEVINSIFDKYCTLDIFYRLN